MIIRYLAGAAIFAACSCFVCGQKSTANVASVSTDRVETLCTGQTWIHLCNAFGIFDSERGKEDHSSEALLKEVGNESDRLIVVGTGEHWNFEILYKPGRLRVAKQFMISVATKYGWRLEFGKRNIFDPRMIKGWTGQLPPE